MAFYEFYLHLKGWQTVIGAILGFGALTWGALYNYHLGRRRDDAVREKEATSVALGLYSEINLISKELAKLANSVGRWYMRTGVSGGSLPAHYSGSFVLPDATLFKALAAKVGMLSPDVLMPITRFYGYYSEVLIHFPKILEDDQRGISYGAEWVLSPAISAIDEVQTALREIERIGGITTPASVPDLQKAQKAVKLANDVNDF